MDWIVFTEDQNERALEWNEETIYQVRPRLIDNPDHSRVGDYVAPARVVTGNYTTFWADKLAGHMRLTALPDGLFAPTGLDL